MPRLVAERQCGTATGEPNADALEQSPSADTGVVVVKV